MYDFIETVDHTDCKTIAKIASLFTDFGFHFRYRFDTSTDYDLETVYQKHAEFIQQLLHEIFLMPLQEQPHYAIEEEGCGFIMWF